MADDDTNANAGSAEEAVGGAADDAAGGGLANGEMSPLLKKLLIGVLAVAAGAFVVFVVYLATDHTLAEKDRLDRVLRDDPAVGSTRLYTVTSPFPFDRGQVYGRVSLKSGLDDEQVRDAVRRISDYRAKRGVSTGRLEVQVDGIRTQAVGEGDVGDRWLDLTLRLREDDEVHAAEIRRYSDPDSVFMLDITTRQKDLVSALEERWSAHVKTLTSPMT